MVYSKVIQKELNVKRNCKVIFFKRKDARIFTNIKNRICSTFYFNGINNLSEYDMIKKILWLVLVFILMTNSCDDRIEQTRTAHVVVTML